MKVMFDTNVFSNLSNGLINPSRIPPGWEPVATHIQWDEIQQTTAPERRAKIEAVFRDHLTEKVSTTSAAWDVSAWDEAEWPGPSSAYALMKQQMDGLKTHKNNAKDALIADTCFQKGFLLVTNDRTLAEVARTHGVRVVNLQDAAAP